MPGVKISLSSPRTTFNFPDLLHSLCFLAAFTFALWPEGPAAPSDALCAGSSLGASLQLRGAGPDLGRRMRCYQPTSEEDETGNDGFGVPDGAGELVHVLHHEHDGSSPFPQEDLLPLGKDGLDAFHYASLVGMHKYERRVCLHVCAAGDGGRLGH